MTIRKKYTFTRCATIALALVITIFSFCSAKDTDDSTSALIIKEDAVKLAHLSSEILSKLSNNQEFSNSTMSNLYLRLHRKLDNIKKKSTTNERRLHSISKDILKLRNKLAEQPSYQNSLLCDNINHTLLYTMARMIFRPGVSNSDIEKQFISLCEYGYSMNSWEAISRKNLNIDINLHNIAEYNKLWEHIGDNSDLSVLPLFDKNRDGFYQKLMCSLNAKELFLREIQTTAQLKLGLMAYRFKSSHPQSFSIWDNQHKLILFYPPLQRKKCQLSPDGPIIRNVEDVPKNNWTIYEHIINEPFSGLQVQAFLLTLKNKMDNER